MLLKIDARRLCLIICWNHCSEYFLDLYAHLGLKQIGEHKEENETIKLNVSTDQVCLLCHRSVVCLFSISQMILNAHGFPLCDSCIGVFKSPCIFMIIKVKNCLYIFRRPKRFVIRAPFFHVEVREKSKSDMASIKKVELTDLFLFYKNYSYILLV